MEEQDTNWRRKPRHEFESMMLANPSFFSLIFSLFFSLLIVGEVQCEQPNNSLYTFTGNLIIEKQTLPLSPNQLLLRVWFYFPSLYFHMLGHCFIAVTFLFGVQV